MQLKDRGIFSAAKRVFPTGELLQILSQNGTNSLWSTLLRELDCTHVCVKPAADGCSTGVARLDHVADLTSYLAAVRDRRPSLAPGALSTSGGGVEMAVPPPGRFMFEPFIETDPILIRRSAEQIENNDNGAVQSTHNEIPSGGVDEPDRASFSRRNLGEGASHVELVWEGKSRWVEVTVGVLGRKGSMKALSPSITVKESGHVLSLEEKFQGGTGVNLTPPPPQIVR
jgi:hypothetical protein